MGQGSEEKPGSLIPGLDPTTRSISMPMGRAVADAKAGIGAWLSFYNDERQHQSLGYRTPRQIYQEGLWICGRSALPTGSASPAPEQARKAGKC